jgi:hypothetical protein
VFTFRFHGVRGRSARPQELVRHPRRSKGHGAPGTTIRPMLELACESRDEGALGTSDFGGPLRRLFIVIAHWYDRHSRAGRCVADFGRGD